MNLRYLVLPVFMLFLLSGCTHFSVDHQKETASSPYSDEASDKIFDNGQLVERADIRASDLSETGEGEADSAADSDAEAVSDLGTKSNAIRSHQFSLDAPVLICILDSFIKTFVRYPGRSSLAAV